jgi:mRNA-degrading endonuclease RelE of RelBE toxin-antitoxin system
MEKRFVLIFDEVITKQLRKAAKNNQVKQILTKMLDKIELQGPGAGELLDSKLFLYEIKTMHPPLRLYYKHDRDTNEVYIFQYEMKTSQDSQQKTIDKIRHKALEP